MSGRSYLSIGDVLSLLRQEFPDVTISKIRFLESQGLVNPERTPSGYRKFYEHDVERLRWVLRQQREHFLPLKVIKDRLEDGPNGTSPPGRPPSARAATGSAPTPVAGPTHPTSEPALVGTGGPPGTAPRSSAPPPARPTVGSPAGAIAPPAGVAPRQSAAAGGPEGPTSKAVSHTTTATIPGPGVSGLPVERSAAAGASASPPAQATDDRPTSASGGSSPLTSPPATKPPPSVAPTLPAAAIPVADGSPPPTRRSGPDLTSARSEVTPSPPSTPSPVIPTSPSPAVGTGNPRSTPGAGSNATPAPLDAHVTLDELATASGLTVEVLDQLRQFGLLAATPVGGTDYYDDEAVAVATLAAGFARFGVEPRHLRLYKNAADREAGFVEQIVLPLVRQRNPDSRARAVTTSEELLELGQGLRRALLRNALRELFGN